MAGKKKSVKKRPRLTREMVLEAAMALADEVGSAGLSMRRLAERLGVEAMSLYHHVAGKEAILDAMVDAVFDEIALEWELPPDPGDWKSAMRRRSLAARSVLKRHPWALGLLESRVNPGPATIAYHEAVIACLRRSGFSIELTAHAFSALDSYTYGFVLQELNLPFQSGAELREIADSMLTAMPAGLYPRMREMIEYTLRPGYDYAREFEIGLDLMLDGLALLSRG